MFVKYENGEVVSLLVDCVPDEVDGFVEIPDDQAIIDEYMSKHRKPSVIPTAEERIAALEDQLLAAKILLGVD